MTDWPQNEACAWTRTLCGLLLRATADPGDAGEPWTWEVVIEEDMGTEYEVDLGGAVTREAAMAAAEAIAQEIARGR